MDRHRHVIAVFLIVCAGGYAGSPFAQEAAQPAPSTSAATVPAPPASPPVPALVHVLLHTTLGDLRLALEKDRAPLTVRNFLRYVDQKRFDGSAFYRAVRIGDDGKYGLVQGGLRGNPKRVLKPVAHEAPGVTGLSHVSGAVSMARGNPGTATADFFIVLGDLTSLDGKPGGEDPGYAVFGRVVEGMDVVLKMLDLPRAAEGGEGAMKGQMIDRPVRIISVRRSELAGTTP
jgi:peptidyl-prolyl cis-trans isomerase A (cyclophilin A)